MDEELTAADCHRQAELEFEIAHSKERCRLFHRRLMGKYWLFKAFHSEAMNAAVEVALQRYSAPLIHWRGRLLAAQNELEQLKQKRLRARAMNVAQSVGVWSAPVSAVPSAQVVRTPGRGQLPFFGPDAPVSTPAPTTFARPHAGASASAISARTQTDVENDIAFGFEKGGLSFEDESPSQVAPQATPLQPELQQQASVQAPPHRSETIDLTQLPELFPPPTMPDMGPLPETIRIDKLWPLLLALSPLPKTPQSVETTETVPNAQCPSAVDTAPHIQTLDSDCEQGKRAVKEEAAERERAASQDLQAEQDALRRVSPGTT